MKHIELAISMCQHEGEIAIAMVRKWKTRRLWQTVIISPVYMLLVVAAIVQHNRFHAAIYGTIGSSLVALNWWAATRAINSGLALQRAWALRGQYYKRRLENYPNEN